MLKNARIGELRGLGLLPIPLTLEITHTLKHGQDREQYWIFHYAYLSAPLTNEIRPALVKRLKAALSEKTTSVTFQEHNPAGPSLADMPALAKTVLRLQADGKQKPEIMREIWKVNPGGSEAYRAAQEEYQLVMSFIAEQLGA